VISAPLLFATLGALCTEYTGVLAVFMDGAITFSGFVCIAVTGATGNPFIGFLGAVLATGALLFAVARFNEATGANPFLTGLAVNLFVSGITSWLSAAWYGTRGVIALSSLGTSVSFPRNFSFPVAVVAAFVIAFLLRYTTFGLHLKITGTSEKALVARGVSPAKYRTVSWVIAGIFAACAGSILSLDLGAFVPNVSAGRGWTALAAVFLGYKNPLLVIGAVLLFSGAEYTTSVLQGVGKIPATVILGFPYALALIVFILVPQKKQADQ
jgi:simple sugar transport system permease protein